MKNNIEKLVFTALFAALTAVMAQITVPLPFGVPFTLQTLAVALGGYCLGLKHGVLSVLCYILLGMVGIPVFSMLGGGVGVLFGSGGGFIFGFTALSAACGLSLLLKAKVLRLFISLAGLILCHLCGIVQYSLITGSSFIPSFLAVSAPYLLKDVLSVTAAYALYGYTKRLFTLSKR